MIRPSLVRAYGIFSFIALVVLLILVVFRFIPESLFLTVFLIAVVLYLIRLTLRLVLARQQRVDQEVQRRQNVRMEERRDKGEAPISPKEE